MRNKIFIIFILSLTTILISSSLLKAHENTIVHKGLTEKAKDFLISQEVGYEEIEDYFFIDGTCNDIEEGSVKEDNFFNNIVCWIAPLSWLEHAYNPINKKGWFWGSGTALNKAKNEFQEALDEYKTDNKERSYFQLGRVAHLLADMTSPAHVHSDMHIWEKDFEKWSINQYSSYSSGTLVRQPSVLTITEFFKNLSLKTYYASSFQAELTWSNPQPDSELKQMFPSLQFVWVGWEGTTYFEIDNVGEYWPIIGDSNWWECEDDAGYYYIENSGGEDGNGVFPQKIRNNITDRDSFLINNSKELHVIWAEELFPLTIDYISGLFKYFYDITRGIDVVLVIDRSGSMSSYSKITLAKTASKMFVDLMQEYDKIGVVSFSDYSNVNYPLTIIDSDGNAKLLAKNAINNLYASGMTSIGGGIQEGQNQLTTRGINDPIWAMVLLSDGIENTPPMVRDILPNIISTKTKIYSIGLGAGADEALLNTIALITGGFYRFAPSGADLAAIYQDIQGAVEGLQGILSQIGNIIQGTTQFFKVGIDSSIIKAIFTASIEGSDIDLILIKPDGTIVNPSIASTDPSITFISGYAYEAYIILSPMSGEWEMQVIGTDVAPGGELINVNVSALTTLTLALNFDKIEYSLSEPINISVEIKDSLGPILGTNVNSDIQTPSGTTNLTLYDDGTHSDTIANDGIYTAAFTNTYQKGSYTFKINALGTSNTDEIFTRTTTKSTVVGNDSDNDGMSDVWEDIYGLNKYQDDSAEDPDNDGLSNLEEYKNRTHPKDSDTDNDGYSDGEEISAGSDPLDSDSVPNQTPPIADAGTDQTIPVGSDCIANITLDGSASFDSDGDALTYSWSWDNGSATGINPTIQLPLGTHIISLVVNDGTINSAPDEAEITVIDTTPPEITLSVSPNTLWPPNHKMVLIPPIITANDNCDPNPIIELESITMNEGEETNTYDPAYDDTVGDGHTLDDIQVDEDGNIYLRAERSGTGNGRIYTITYTATDSAGNSSSASATVTVPHDQQ